MADGAAPATTSRAARTADLAVALFAMSMAGLMLARSLPHADELWRAPLHDRNGHYLFGLKLAVATYHLDIAAFFTELAKAMVWPPVHGLVLSAVLLATGFDHRFGVVPSLIGWAVTVWFCWKIATRAFDDRSSGIVAGLVAVALVATSPALALLATDVMLEGLGSGLSAFCLWAFMAVYDESRKAARWRTLGIGLALLFFEKYNYWAFVIASIAVTAVLISPAVRSFTRTVLRALPAGLVALLRRPFVIAGLLVVAGAIAIDMRGPTSVAMFGRTVSLYPPNNIVTIAYILAFIGAVQAWREHRAAIGGAVGDNGMILFRWAVLPVAVSFLLPRRLASFLWFLGPSNTGAAPKFDPLGALGVYARVVVEGFFALPAIGWACLGLVFVAFLLMTKLRPGARVLLVFLAISTLALVAHPQHQPRFVATSMFALFCAAGIGVAMLVQLVVPRRLATLRLGLGAIAAAALFAGQFLLPYPDMAYTTAIRDRTGASNLDLVALYAPYLAGEQQVAVGATFGEAALLAWPLIEACRCELKVEQPHLGVTDTRIQIAAAGAEWLAQTPARKAVIVDVPSLAGAPYVYGNLVGLRDAVAAQSRFKLIQTIPSKDPAGQILILERQ